MRRTILVAVLAAALASIAAAKNYTVVIAQLSPVSTDAYTKVISAIIEATGNTATVQVLPFARAVYMVETKQADIESTIVAIPDKAKWPDLKFDYATAEALKIVFVLYANKAKPIDVAELKKGNPKGYKLETDSAHVNHFNFAIAGSTSVDASLKKVDAGTIDGYIFGQPSADAALKRLGYKNVAREYYDTWSGSFLIQKGGRGGETDKMISDGLAKIKASGKYQQIMGDVMAAGSKYNEWQP